MPLVSRDWRVFSSATSIEREIAQQIVRQKDDYVLAVRENQDGLSASGDSEMAERADYAHAESH